MKKIREEEIRPQRFLKDQKIMANLDLKRMLSKKNKFVKVSCPACGESKTKDKIVKNNLKYVYCKKCNTLYMNPRPAPEVLDWFYKNSPNYEYWNKYIFPATEDKRREKIFSPRVDQLLDLCNKYSLKKDSLLEIGCAFGTFCLELKSRRVFNKIVGVEPTPDLAKTAKKRGIKVIEEMIEDIDLEEKELFDVVVNFEVIEHIFSPSKFILNCKKMLKPGGILILTCPNGEGFDFVTLKEKCNSLDHEHLNYFNTKSLPLLLKSTGFEILEVTTPGELDAELVRKKILLGELDVTTQPFLKQILIKKWDQVGDKFQNFLSDSKLSSNMWVVARKK
jgi:2-polyprenyl-3-methyl-5-hydroxy-6-metoxy-1,4-benzoquinol methylase